MILAVKISYLLDLLHLYPYLFIFYGKNPLHYQNSASQVPESFLPFSDDELIKNEKKILKIKNKSNKKNFIRINCLYSLMCL